MSMMVTSIVPFDKRRSKVFLEEDFAFVLYKGEIRKYHLEEGAELSQEQYHEIITQVIFKRARERALNILKNSDKTELELRRKLQEGLYPEEAIDAALKMLKDYRYVDDDRYAERYIESFGNKKSRRQISFDLERKGIRRDTITRLLEENPIEEEQQVRAFLRKKHYDKENADARELSKLTASLGRKGFSFEIIRRILTENFDNDVF